jgi:pantoate--beta-alanine ligase
MKVIKRLADMRAVTAEAKKHRKSISFVPTLGALHAGHLSLVEAACLKGGLVVVSIFVNPIQFGAHEDFSRYPRTLIRDKKLLSNFKVDALFLPSASEMYGEDFQTYVEVSKLSQTMCGHFRPGHFRGVATVVAKLFNIIQPDFAFFGEKDFQQLRIIEQMVADLNLPTGIVALPTVREFGGLAMSSRNKYLGARERSAARVLYQALLLGKALIDGGEKRSGAVLRALRRKIKSEPLAKLEYLVLVDPKTLESQAKIKGEVRLALAAYIGKTRLIDNLRISAK